MDATEKVMKVWWRKYEGKWELMWVFILVHPPFFGKGCAVSLAVHIRVGEHRLPLLLFHLLCKALGGAQERCGHCSSIGVRSSNIIGMQGGDKVIIFLGKIFLWALESVRLVFPCFYTLVFSSSAPYSSWRTVFEGGGNSRLVLHLWLMLGKVGDGYFKCLTYHLYKQCFAKFKCCSQCLNVSFNDNWLRKDLHALDGQAMMAVLLLPSEMLLNRSFVKLLNRHSRQPTSLYPVIKKK